MSAPFNGWLGDNGHGQPASTRARDRAASPLRRLTVDAPGASGERHTAPPPSPPSSLPPMPPLAPLPGTAKPSRRLPAVLGLVAGSVVLVALALAAYLGYQFLLGHDDRATAAYAPSNAWVYLALNTDPTSRAWLDAWMLARNAGIDDDLKQLPGESLEESGKDPSSWEAMIKPAIGGEVGLVVWPHADGIEEAPHVAAIVMIGDQEKARQSIATMLDGHHPTAATYRAIDYQFSDNGDTVGIVDQALVVAASEDGFKAVVDARLDGALDGQPRFQSATKRATGDPLVFGWFDAIALADAAEDLFDRTDGAPATGAVATSLQTYRDIGVATLTVKADGDALRTVVLTEGRPSNFPTAPAVNSFAADAPASTIFFMASANLYDTVMRPMVEQSSQVSGVDLLGGLGDSVGFDLERDLLAQLVGPYALAIGAGQQGKDLNWQFQLSSAVKDAAAVRGALHSLADNGAALGVETTRLDNGFSLSRDDVSARVTVENGVFRLTTTSGIAATSGSLADDPDFRRAMEGMPGGASLTGYLALHRLVDLLAAQAPTVAPEHQALLDALGPLAYVALSDGQGTRTEVALFINRR